MAGVGYATGLVRSIAGQPGLWVHIAVVDLSRRTFLRAGLYFAAGAVRLDGLPGARRRFTGSCETGSFDPDAMPTTSWLVDRIPAVDPDRWRLTVVDGAARYQLGLNELGGTPGAAAHPARGVRRGLTP